LERSEDHEGVAEGIAELIEGLGVEIGIAALDPKQFGEEDLENTGTQNVPGGIDQEIDLEGMEGFIHFVGPVIVDGIGGLAEFARRWLTLFGLQPGKETVLMDIADGSAAFTRVVKGLQFIVIETDSAIHDWRRGVRPGLSSF